MYILKKVYCKSNEHWYIQRVLINNDVDNDVLCLLPKQYVEAALKINISYSNRYYNYVLATISVGVIFNFCYKANRILFHQPLRNCKSCFIQNYLCNFFIVSMLNMY